MRFRIELSPSASPRLITLIIALGFASANYQNNLPSASPRAIISRIALYPIRLVLVVLTSLLSMILISGVILITQWNFHTILLAVAI